MAAVPKKKLSKTRIKRRKSQWAAKKAASELPLVRCKNCNARKQPHRVCRECGYYRGQLVSEPKTKVKRVST